ncbi:MAG: membrane integrity-associated transporter subunit PqiC [Thiomargarita sp.]|nr:membrane integrity-associated transporter subunit PqiC [Thiomargarita sp.]
MKRRHYTIILCILLLQTLISPAAFAKKTKLYLLNGSWEKIIIPASDTGKTLLISTPTAAPGFDTTVLMYSKGGYELSYYTDAKWVDTPARMLLPLIVHRLETTRLFKAVLSDAISPIFAELRLDTEILRLQHYRKTYPYPLRFVLRAQLLDLTERTVIATQVFKIKTNAPSDNAEGGMFAAKDAVALMLNELENFIRAHIKVNTHEQE